MKINKREKIKLPTEALELVEIEEELNDDESSNDDDNV